MSRYIIQKFVDEWIVDIQDYTPLTRKMYELIQRGYVDKAGKLAPKEKVYSVDAMIAKRLMMV